MRYSHVPCENAVACAFTRSGGTLFSSRVCLGTSPRASEQVMDKVMISPVTQELLEDIPTPALGGSVWGC